MNRSEDIPAPAVRRLSLYLRQLETLRDTNLRTISSKQLGQALNITDAQVRKDLAYFGQFGQPGIGYEVDALIRRIRGILGTDRIWNVVLVGAGNLGRALASYRGFARKGFSLAAIVDTDPSKVGKVVSPDVNLPVTSFDQLAARVHADDIRLAVLAVPADVAQEVADQLIAMGIRGILNFAPVALQVPADVSVASVDMAVHLEQLSFNVSATGRQRPHNPPGMPGDVR